MKLESSYFKYNFKGDINYITMKRLETFEIDSKKRQVRFIDSNTVKRGVHCDVYEFVGDSSCDLAIVEVQPGQTTPLQLIVQGDKTIEGYVEGSGELSIIAKSGDIKILEFNKHQTGNVVLGVGDTMQWQASENQKLVFYEVCYPSYQEGRFQNLS